MGWITSIFTRNRSHLVKKEGVRSNVRARMKTPLSFRASAGASGGECRFEWKGDPCKYRHDPTDKSREQNESGGGASGAVHKKPKAGIHTVSNAFAAGDGEGSGKGEAPLNRSRATTNRGAGSVSWRGQIWRPNGLRFQRMTCGLYGQGWSRFLNQEQKLGEKGGKSLYRRFGHQHLRRSVARSSERTYASCFRCWCTFRGN